MSFVRFDPFREMAVLQDRVNRVLGDHGRHGDEEGLTRGAWVPAVDIFETEGHELVLKAELPDLTREAISLKVENNTLTLSGEKKIDSEVKDSQYIRTERAIGTFSRAFTLPTSVDSARISAEYKNGVLTVRLPRREDTRPKQIQVQVS